MWKYTKSIGTIERWSQECSMLFTQTAYIGIDPTAGPKSIAYAAIDGNLRLMALGIGELDEVLAFMGGQHQAVVAINGPGNVNQGLMKSDEIREKLAIPPKPGRSDNLRLAEYLLQVRNLPIYHTPAKEEKAKPWLRLAFNLTKRLQSLGYGSEDLEMIEALADVCYQVWLGHPLFGQRSLEGRLQRQLVLFDLGLDIPDPMMYFEEITRFRILQGVLPEEHLFNSFELQVLAIAYIAWAKNNKPEDIEVVGDEKEGQIFLPSEKAYSFNKK